MLGAVGKVLIAAGICSLLAGSAFAGDKFAPPPGAFDPPPPKQTALPKSKQHDWTGFYAGVQGGGAFGNASSKSNIDSGASPTLGAHAGYNYQFGQGLVLGGESDVSK
jgi:outer membrane immunogenic protein